MKTWLQIADLKREAYRDDEIGAMRCATARRYRRLGQELYNERVGGRGHAPGEREGVGGGEKGGEWGGREGKAGWGGEEEHVNICTQGCVYIQGGKVDRVFVLDKYR